MKNTIKLLAILFSMFIMSCNVDDDNILDVENNISESMYIDSPEGPGEEDDVEDDELERNAGPGEEDDVEDDELERS